MTASKSLLFGVLGLLTGCLIAIVVNAQELTLDPIVSIETLPVPDVVPPTDIIFEPIPEPTPEVIIELPKETEAEIKADLLLAVETEDKLLIEQKQTDLFLVKGEYEQVKIGDEEKINVYESPDGWGYQLVEKLPNKIIYTGYGAEANSYTVTVNLPVPTKSTSTSGLNSEL